MFGVRYRRGLIFETMKTLATLRVKIYADGADKQSMLQMNVHPLIKGIRARHPAERHRQADFVRGVFR